MIRGRGRPPKGSKKVAAQLTVNLTRFDRARLARLAKAMPQSLLRLDIEMPDAALARELIKQGLTACESEFGLGPLPCVGAEKPRVGAVTQEESYDIHDL